MTRSHIRITIILLLGITFLAVCAYWINYSSKDKGILGATSSDGLHTQAIVTGCELYITAYPEKRIPAFNNWDTILNVQIRNSSNSSLVADFTLSTDALGTGFINLCDSNITILPGTYDILLTGYSHLRQVIPSVTSFDTYTTNLTFSNFNERLIAGEMSGIFDNYVNSLDAGYLLGVFGTGDYKADLNQDGIVNSLDFSNTIYNFFVYGD